MARRRNYISPMAELEVRGMLGDTTWEPLAACKDLEALDLYLELQGIAHPRNLPKRI